MTEYVFNKKHEHFKRLRGISHAVEDNFFDWLFIYQAGILAVYIIACLVTLNGGVR